MTQRELLPKGAGSFVLIITAALAISVFRALVTDDFALVVDNDSAMRLVQVRDLMRGQSWFDVTQYRLGLGPGVDMHWSRLIDGIMVAFLRISSSMVGEDWAEWALLIAWPATWAAVTLWATLNVAVRLGGPYARFPTVIMLTPSLFAIAHFFPGNIDHHNVQIAILTCAIWFFAARNEKIYYPVFLGFALALSLSIGIDIFPQITFFSIMLAGTWAFGGYGERTGTIVSMASLAGALVLLFALTAPPAAYLGGYCDTISADIFVPFLGASLSLLVVAALYKDQHPRRRLGALFLVGATVCAAALIAYPACLSNPLDSIDPYLDTYWLSNVAEAQGAQHAFANGKLFYTGSYFLALGAIVICSWLVMVGRSRPEIWLLVGLIAVGLLVGAYQIRAVPALTVTSVLPWILLAAHLRLLALKSPCFAAQLVAAGTMLVAAPQVWALTQLAFEWTNSARNDPSEPAILAAADEERASCFDENSAEAINRLPAGRVATTSNLGAHVLLLSAHSVLSAPYHRNEAGMIAQLEIALSENAADAERRMAELQVDYLILCTEDPEIRLRAATQENPDTLFTQLVSGEVSLETYDSTLKAGNIVIFSRVDLPRELLTGNEYEASNSLNGASAVGN